MLEKVYVWKTIFEKVFMKQFCLEHFIWDKFGTVCLEHYIMNYAQNTVFLNQYSWNTINNIWMFGTVSIKQ